MGRVQNSFVKTEEVRLGILRDAYDRTKKSQSVLSTPSQYSTELGIPEEEISLNLRYLIGKQFLNGTVSTMTGGMVIIDVSSITARGIEAVELASLSPPQSGGTTVTVHGDMIGSQLAVGSTVAGNMTNSAAMTEIYNEAVKQIEASEASQEDKSAAKAMLKFAKDNAPKFLPAVFEAAKKTLGL